MRKTFETERDRRAERSAIDEYAIHFRAKAEKLPRSYRLDFALVREQQIVAFVEFKRRYFSSSAFPSLMVTLSKYEAMIRISEASSVPSVLLCELDDALLSVRVERSLSSVPGFKLVWGGRKKMRDDQDREPQVLIPIERFTVWR